MTHPAPSPHEAIIELETRTAVCTAPDCGGTVVRHSLGGGQSVDRCTRCFRRFRVRSAARSDDGQPGVLRRMLDEFVSWRE
jgi:hypothetical protein